MKYDAVIFDFYGTLVNVQTSEDKASVWDKLSLFMAYKNAAYSATELKEAYGRLRDKQLSRHSHLEWPEYDVLDIFHKLYMDKDIKVKPRLIKNTALVYRTLSMEDIRVYKDVKDVLEELKKMGKKLYIVENGQKLFISAELKMLGLDQYFDDVIASSDHHISKPNPKLLHLLIESEKLDKRKTVMIGSDYSTDIKGACSAGIDSLFIMTEASNRKVKKEKATYTIEDGKHKKIIKVLSNV